MRILRYLQIKILLLQEGDNYDVKCLTPITTKILVVEGARGSPSILCV